MRNLVRGFFLEIPDGDCPAEFQFKKCGSDKDSDNDSDSVEKEEGFAGYNGCGKVQRLDGSSSSKSSNCITFIEEKRPHLIGECKLPTGLVERIFAMIPFPYIFKVRTLSRTWYTKFPLANPFADPIVHGFWHGKTLVQHGEYDFSSPVKFQDLVSSVSTRWPVFCPVILGDAGLIGYEPVKKKWRILLILPDLKRLVGTMYEPWLMSSCGPLMCGVSQSVGSNCDVLVTNVVTKRWKTLPSHPNKQIPSLVNLVFDSSEVYKVFLVTEDPYEGPHAGLEDIVSQETQRCICTQVFDSRSGEWAVFHSQIPAVTSFAWRSCSVHFDGNFYCLSGDDRNPIERPLQLWICSMKEGTWTEIDHQFSHLKNRLSGKSVLLDLSRFNLFVCGSKIIVVLALDPNVLSESRVERDTLFIFELDPETHLITEKSRGPPFTVSGNSEHMTCDGATIYFCTLDLRVCHNVVVFDLESGIWDCMAPDFKTAQILTNKRWADFAFQPGLNPFIIL